MNILITGGTGSLGQALTKRLYNHHDLTIFSRDESRQSQMKARYPNCNYILGDVARLSDLELAARNIDIIYHFAAYKMVPSAQNNALSTIETNVIGSRNVGRAAIMADVKQVVAASTDKACLPVNLYGTSKYLMEAMFQDLNKYGPTTFHLARYGNVVSSSGSVIPLFQKQAERGGPLSVTHLEMTRFWISIEAAVDLIQAALNEEPGVVVVPAAKAMSIVNVAKMVGGDLPVKEIGIRPGEKIHEAMVSEAESFYTEVRDMRYIKGIERLYLIHPPTGSFRNEFAPFEYTSDTCSTLSPEDLMEMIEDYDNSRIG